RALRLRRLTRRQAAALHPFLQVPGKSYAPVQGRSRMARAKVKTYKEQKFDLHGLDGISDKQLEEHFALYAGYVKQVNALNEELAKLRGEGKASGKNPEFAELTRRLGFEYDGMILHEYYFSNLRKAAEPQ